MLNKFSLGVLCAISFSFLSCNRNDEKKNEILSDPAVTVTATLMPPSNDQLMLEKKLEQDSTNLGLRTTLATSYYSAGTLEKAAYHFMKVYENDNKNLIALSNLGNIFYDSQQDDKAIQFYEKALEIDPKNINMKCDLATCYSRINKLKKAIQILRENIEMDKNHAQSHYNLSVIQGKRGDEQEAKAEMEIYNNLKLREK